MFHVLAQCREPRRSNEELHIHYSKASDGEASRTQERNEQWEEDVNGHAAGLRI